MDNVLEVVLSLVADIAATGCVGRAQRGPRDAIAAELVNRWASLQGTVAELLGTARARGDIDQAQYGFAINWLADIDRYPPEDTWAHLEAWFQWTEQTRGGKKNEPTANRASDPL